MSVKDGPELTAAPVLSHAAPVTPAAPAPVVKAERTEPVSSSATERARAVDGIVPQSPAGPTRPAELVAVSSAVEAVPGADATVEITEAPRPPARPPGLGEEPVEPEPGPVSETEPRPAQEPALQETADVPASPARPAEAPVAQAGQGASPDATAQQAAASYPALVMQRLSRTRRDRLSVSGTAVIAFTVGDGGGLVALVIAQGSGVEQIDLAGLALVQSAAPFPPPPPGAQRSYTFQFTGD